MTIIQGLIFGALQGATEFLPVSSSGHLAVLKTLLDLAEVPILFDVILHIATLIAVVVVFRARVAAILGSLARWIVRRSGDGDGENLRLAWVIALATIVTAALGLLVGRLEVGSSPRLVSLLFVVTGGILIASRFVSGNRTYREIGLRESLVVGFAQGLGVFPGISRSGITISAGLVSGLERERAGEFAFLVSIPAIVGAFALTLRDAGELSESVSFAALAAGFVTALVVGLVALVTLVRLVKRGKLWVFSFYLIPVGIAGLIYFRG